MIMSGEMSEYKNRKFDGICDHCGQKGHISRDCWAWKNGHYKNSRKQKKLLMETKMSWRCVH